MDGLTHATMCTVRRFLRDNAGLAIAAVATLMVVGMQWSNHHALLRLVHDAETASSLQTPNVYVCAPECRAAVTAPRVSVSRGGGGLSCSTSCARVRGTGAWATQVHVHPPLSAALLDVCARGPVCAVVRLAAAGGHLVRD